MFSCHVTTWHVEPSGQRKRSCHVTAWHDEQSGQRKRNFAIIPWIKFKRLKYVSERNKTVYYITIGRTHVWWSVHMFHGCVILWIKFKLLVSCFGKKQTVYDIIIRERMCDDVSIILFHGRVTLWIKFKRLVSCFRKKQNRLWYNYWNEARLMTCPFVSRPCNFMNKVQTAGIMFLKETKPFMIIIRIRSTQVWKCVNLFHGPVNNLYHVSE